MLHRARTDAPRAVIHVFVHDEDAARFERAADAGHEIARPLHERKDPSRPCAIRVERGQLVLIEINLHCFDLRYVASSKGVKKSL